MVSPTNTGPGLTRGGPLAEARGQPGVFYPTGERNFFRVVAREDVQGTAHAMDAKRLGLKRVQALYPSDDDTWKVVVADPFSRAARRLGLSVAGALPYDPGAKSYDALADRVARSRRAGRAPNRVPAGERGRTARRRCAPASAAGSGSWSLTCSSPVPDVLDEHRARRAGAVPEHH